MESYIPNSSYYVSKKNQIHTEYYDQDGNLLQKLSESKTVEEFDNLLDPKFKGMAKVDKIIFSPHENMETIISFIDKNSNVILSKHYGGKLTKEGIISYYQWDDHINKDYYKCNLIDYAYIKNNNIEIDSSQMKKIIMPNSSYYIMKKINDIYFAEFYNRHGNSVGLINLLDNEKNDTSSSRLDNLIDPYTKGVAQIKKISFSHHIELGRIINFIDKNHNVVCYQKYTGLTTKNGIINRYKNNDHYLDNKIDFDYIKNNDDIEICRYDPKLNVDPKLCILF